MKGGAARESWPWRLRLVRQVSFPAGVALVASIVAHGVTLLAWLLRSERPEPYVGFAAVFCMLLSLSCLLSVAMLLLDGLALFRVLLALRFLLVVGIGRPFAEDVGFSMALTLAAVLEVTVYEEPAASWAVGCALVAGSLLCRLDGLLHAPPSSWLQLLCTCSLAGFSLAVVGSLMTRHRQRVIGLLEEVNRLDKAVSDISEASRGYLEVAHTVKSRSEREERDRITRELHDTIGYSFTNLIMMMEAARALADVDADRLRGTLTQACEQAQRGLAETRRALYLLREHDDEPKGLAGIEQLVRTFEQATSVAVKVDYANIPMRCGEEAESFIYHFIQEGLTNSFRHGKATHIKIKFWREGAAARIVLSDDGVGSLEMEEGLGMRGMRERLGKLGGTLEARNTSAGFEICAEVPIREE